MIQINAFDPLRTLDEDVLAEVVREGELRLQAQLSTATAADQRALTLAGFQVASASAALAGGGALIVSDKPDPALATVAILFAGAMIVAAAISIKTARPSKFHLPGNVPSGWFPDKWLGAGRHTPDLKQARIEQAACLDDAIHDNMSVAEKAAKSIHRSMNLTIGTVGIAALLMLGVIAIEHAKLMCWKGSWFEDRLSVCAVKAPSHAADRNSTLSAPPLVSGSVTIVNAATGHSDTLDARVGASGSLHRAARWSYAAGRAHRWRLQSGRSARLCAPLRAKGEPRSLPSDLAPPTVVKQSIAGDVTAE
jgi:hypothetical protein